MRRKFFSNANLRKKNEVLFVSFAFDDVLVDIGNYSVETKNCKKI